MKALQAAPAIALASHVYFTKDRRERARIQTPMRVLLSARVDHRFTDGSGAAFIEIALNASPQNLAALVIEKLFEIAMSHSINRLQMGDNRIKMLPSRQVGVSLIRFESCHRAGPAGSEIFCFSTHIYHRGLARISAKSAKSLIFQRFAVVLKDLHPYHNHTTISSGFTGEILISSQQFPKSLFFDWTV